jgi:hypothetical protein
MTGDIILDRRRCLAGMVTAVAASQLGMIDFAAGKTAADSRERSRMGATDPSLL